MSINNFTNRAEAYAKGRPGYPKEVIHKIMELAPAGTVFADIGAGTGKFTKDIAEYGYKVYAVEPNADMRKQLVITCSSYENVEILAGSAENTMIPSRSVDILTVAHALHWFNLDAFRKECGRILKPGGMIMVIYNHVPGKELIDFCRQAVDAFFTNPTIWTFQNPINYNRENWLAYIASQDDSPLPGEAGYEEHIKGLNEAFDRDSVGGVLCCDRITKVYSERI